MEPAEILNRLQLLGAAVAIKDGGLRVKHPKSASAKIKALGPEIMRHKAEIIRILEEKQQPATERILGGHRVHRLIWETEKAVIFQDEKGSFWRYLHDYREAWPVVIENQGDSIGFLERISRY